MKTDTMKQGPSTYHYFVFYLRGAVMIIFGAFLMVFLSFDESLIAFGLTFGMIFIFFGLLVIYIGKQEPQPVPAPPGIPPRCSACEVRLVWREYEGRYYCNPCGEYRDQTQDFETDT